jgi:signal transduction histidine kinase
MKDTTEKSVIICVDDEQTVLRSLKRELGDAFGGRHYIETAETGQETLELIDELRRDRLDISVVLSDHIMTDMKGDELLIRVHGLLPKTLKIMLTGQANMEAVTNAVNHADLYRYIAKPWEMADLVLTVKEALRRYTQEQRLAAQNAMLQNMTEVLEQQVQERTAALEAQQLALQHANTQLHELNASKDKFFSIIAHDLKSPFTSLLGQTELLIEHFELYSPDELRDEIGSLGEAARKLYDLLENLLAWSRLQRGIMDRHPRTFDLAQIIDENVALFQATAGHKQVRLTTRVQPSIMVHTDPNMISAVLRNLISNALKFTQARDTVTIDAREQDTCVEVAVSDTGTGISPEVMARLFRIDQSHTQTGTDGEIGTGLGLVLCQELLKQNGGRISVESEPGRGTIVTFRLPALSALSEC